MNTAGVEQSNTESCCSPRLRQRISTPVRQLKLRTKSPIHGLRDLQSKGCGSPTVEHEWKTRSPASDAQILSPLRSSQFEVVGIIPFGELDKGSPQVHSSSGSDTKKLLRKSPVKWKSDMSKSSEAEGFSSQADIRPNNMTESENDAMPEGTGDPPRSRTQRKRKRGNPSRKRKKNVRTVNCEDEKEATSLDMVSTSLVDVNSVVKQEDVAQVAGSGKRKKTVKTKTVASQRNVTDPEVKSEVETAPVAAPGDPAGNPDGADGVPSGDMTGPTTGSRKRKGRSRSSSNKRNRRKPAAGAKAKDCNGGVAFDVSSQQPSVASASLPMAKRRASSPTIENEWKADYVSPANNTVRGTAKSSVGSRKQTVDKTSQAKESMAGPKQKEIKPSRRTASKAKKDNTDISFSAARRTSPRKTLARDRSPLGSSPVPDLDELLDNKVSECTEAKSSPLCRSKQGDSGENELNSEQSVLSKVVTEFPSSNTAEENGVRSGRGVRSPKTLKPNHSGLTTKGPQSPEAVSGQSPKWNSPGSKASYSISYSQGEISFGKRSSHSPGSVGSMNNKGPKRNEAPLCSDAHTSPKAVVNHHGSSPCRQHGQRSPWFPNHHDQQLSTADSGPGSRGHLWSSVEHEGMDAHSISPLSRPRSLSLPCHERESAHYSVVKSPPGEKLVLKLRKTSPSHPSSAASGSSPSPERDMLGNRSQESEQDSHPGFSAAGRTAAAVDKKDWLSANKDFDARSHETFFHFPQDAGISESQTTGKPVSNKSDCEYNTQHYDNLLSHSNIHTCLTLPDQKNYAQDQTGYASPELDNRTSPEIPSLVRTPKSWRFAKNEPEETKGKSRGKSKRKNGRKNTRARQTNLGGESSSQKECYDGSSWAPSETILPKPMARRHSADREISEQSAELNPRLDLGGHSKNAAVSENNLSPVSFTGSIVSPRARRTASVVATACIQEANAYFKEKNNGAACRVRKGVNQKRRSSPKGSRSFSETLPASVPTEVSGSVTAGSGGQDLQQQEPDFLERYVCCMIVGLVNKILMKSWK